MTGLCHSLTPFAENHGAQHRCDEDRERHGAEQREGNGPGHGPEQTPFDSLQREDRHVGGDDDGDGEENRPLDLVRCLPDHLQPTSWASVLSARSRMLSVLRRTVLRWLKWRTMFSTITTAPSTTIPKSSAPSEIRFAGIWLKIQKD